MFFSVSGEHLWCHSTDGGVGPDSVVVITPGRPPPLFNVSETKSKLQSWFGRRAES